MENTCYLQASFKQLNKHLLCVYVSPVRVTCLNVRNSVCVAVGRDTAPQARKSRVRYPMVPMESFIDITLPAALYGPGVDSGFSRNEHQGYLLGGNGGRCVGLTNLPT